MSAEQRTGLDRASARALSAAPATVLGWLLARTRLSAVTRVTGPAGAFYLKRRYAYAPLLLWAARQRPAPFRVLPLAAWRLWEPELYRRVYGLVVEPAGSRGLRLPVLPGLTLDAFLRAPGHTRAERLAAVAAALAALRALHALEVRFPDGELRPFSHADATTRNVLYTPATGQARCFDFETVHPAGRTTAWRQADDLRALLYSAAAAFEPQHAPELAACALAAYPEPAVRAALRALAGAVARRPDGYHLAQAQAPRRQQMALSMALLEGERG